jgi:hypothetical protein
VTSSSADPSTGRRALDAHGRITLETPAGTAEVTGRGSRLELKMSNARSGIHVLLGAGWGQSREARRRRITTFDRGLRTAGLGVDIHLKDRWVGRVGAGSRATWVARAVGLPMELPVTRVVPALIPIWKGRTGS